MVTESVGLMGAKLREGAWILGKARFRLPARVDGGAFSRALPSEWIAASREPWAPSREGFFHLFIFFRPFGVCSFFCTLPTACAVGCILSPLCGSSWLHWWRLTARRSGLTTHDCTS